MIAQTPWVERTFNFDFPAGLYPNLLTRLSGTPARVEEMVRGMDEKKLSQRDGERWSVKEHIGHLIDLEELHEQRLGEFIDGKELLTAWDGKNKKTYDANHNNTDIETLLSSLRNTRHHFVGRLEKAGDGWVTASAFHPRLKKNMRLVDMVYFVCEHDDHHLAKIKGRLGSILMPFRLI